MRLDYAGVRFGSEMKKKKKRYWTKKQQLQQPLKQQLFDDGFCWLWLLWS